MKSSVKLFWITAIGASAFYGCDNLKLEIRVDIEKRFGKDSL
jgi:hypothetical protein